MYKIYKYKRVLHTKSTQKKGLFKNRIDFRTHTKRKKSYTYSTLFDPENYLIVYEITTIDLFYRTPFINFFSSLYVL